MVQFTVTKLDRSHYTQQSCLHITFTFIYLAEAFDQNDSQMRNITTNLSQLQFVFVHSVTYFKT